MQRALFRRVLESTLRCVTHVRAAALVCTAFVVVACGKSPTAGDDNLAEVPADLRQLFQFQWTASGDNPSGHGFLVERSGASPIALTAYHVAGQLSANAATAYLRSPLDGVVLKLGNRIPINGAAVIGANGSQNDLAAFAVADWRPSRALRLATTLPAVGDTVYVLAVHYADPANPHPLSGPRRHAARVDVSHESAFVYTYLGSANSDLTSGAAVLDRNGDVVGVNVASRVMNAAAWDQYRERYGPCCFAPTSGEVVGLAVHVLSIHRMLGSSVVPNSVGMRVRR